MGFILGMEGLFNIWKAINIIYQVDSLKKKNNIVIAIDADKAFDNICIYS